MRVGRRRCAEGGRRGSLIYLLGTTNGATGHVLSIWSMLNSSADCLESLVGAHLDSGRRAAILPHYLPLSLLSPLPRIRNAQNMIIAPRNRGRGRTAEPTTRTWHGSQTASPHDMPPKQNNHRVGRSVGRLDPQFRAIANPHLCQWRWTQFLRLNMKNVLRVA